MTAQQQQQLGYNVRSHHILQGFLPLLAYNPKATWMHHVCLYDQAQHIDNPAPANADAGELLSQVSCLSVKLIPGHLVPGLLERGLGQIS